MVKPCEGASDFLGLYDSDLVRNAVVLDDTDSITKESITILN